MNVGEIETKPMSYENEAIKFHPKKVSLSSSFLSFSSVIGHSSSHVTCASARQRAHKAKEGEKESFSLSFSLSLSLSLSRRFDVLAFDGAQFYAIADSRQTLGEGRKEIPVTSHERVEGKKKECLTFMMPFDKVIGHSGAEP